mgnify:CR=1 FL=1|jgi:GNAT superfamily N-acetyltransferase
MKITKVKKETIPQLVDLMIGLADYEKLPRPDAAAVRRTRKALLAENPSVYAMLAWDGKKPVGYAMYFYTFSSFLARPSFYLEDLFVLPEYRAHGYGKALFEKCVQTGKTKGCGRMEWCVLDWNEPAHKFYKKAGARKLNEWEYYRLKLRDDAF